MIHQCGLMVGIVLVHFITSLHSFHRFQSSALLTGKNLHSIGVKRFNARKCDPQSYLFSSISDTQENQFSSTVMDLPTTETTSNPSTTTTALKIVTFNILAPCYKRMPKHYNHPSLSNNSTYKLYESELEEEFLRRNNEICDKLLDTDADVICLQEFWSSSEPLKETYLQRLCGVTPSEKSSGNTKQQNNGKYSMHSLDRTSYWRARDDGLAFFVKSDRLFIEDVCEIIFHDCGDRVALMLVLSLLPQQSKGEKFVPQRFICVNTHLLFPHNLFSTKIRLREMTKILGYIEAYRQRELCDNICGRADVRLPVIITGDFNGSPNGKVYNYVKSQNFQSALESYFLSNGNNTQANATSLTSIPHDHAKSFQPGEKRDPQEMENLVDLNRKWISHRSHRNQLVAVDHIFYCNPSQQTVDQLPVLPDWTNLVYLELMQRLIGKYNDEHHPDENKPMERVDDIQASLELAFQSFDEDDSGYITTEEFQAALGKLGFVGEDGAALTKQEIEVLVKSADRNDDGCIDYKEFHYRFWLATEMMRDYYPSLAAMKLTKVPWAKDNNTTSSIGGASISTIAGKNDAVMLNTRRFAFARSKWLSKRHSSSSNTKNDQSEENVPKMPSFLTTAVSMGDLHVQDADLYPKELKYGIWPEDYTLSDHGMVECTFAVNIAPSPPCLDSVFENENDQEFPNRILDEI